MVFVTSGATLGPPREDDRMEGMKERGMTR